MVLAGSYPRYMSTGSVETCERLTSSMQRSVKNCLEVTPLGLQSGESYTTRIELPVTRKAHCRLELGSRCVLALDPLQYPKDALRDRLSGMVTLAGQVNRDGTVTGVHVVKPQTALPDRLVREAIKNLETWWVEPSPRQDKIRITYSYEIDPSLPPGDRLDVRLALPELITIRSSPPASR